MYSVYSNRNVIFSDTYFELSYYPRQMMYPGFW